MATSRRGLLTGSAAALAIVALPGCGASRPHRRRRLSPTTLDRELALLNGALAVEQRSIAAYTAAGPLLTGAAQRAAAQFLGQELRHTGVLRELIKERHGRAHDPLPHYDLGRPHGTGGLLALLHHLEQQQVAAYLRAIPRVSTPQLRQVLAAILANEAQHVTVLRVQQGLPGLTGPLLSPDQ